MGQARLPLAEPSRIVTATAAAPIARVSVQHEVPLLIWGQASPEPTEYNAYGMAHHAELDFHRRLLISVNQLRPSGALRMQSKFGSSPLLPRVHPQAVRQDVVDRVSYELHVLTRPSAENSVG